MDIPVIDVSSLITLQSSRRQTALAIGRACRQHGFFYITNHGISWDLQQNLAGLSEKFFALDLASKMQIEMKHAGIAWRGYFPVKGELTSGQADIKEGLYFGQELCADHPLVESKTALHGPNLFPALNGFRTTVIDYIKAINFLGHRLIEGISLSLGLPVDYINRHYTYDPLLLFRIFHYPPPSPAEATKLWGVGEHTDYGFLTILKQDECGGLQIKSAGQWIDAPAIRNTFICNIGDMLERLTGGIYKSTPHRVRNLSGRSRYSWPLFFDPCYFAQIKAIPGIETIKDDSSERWDQSCVHHFQGTYGDYLLNKVGKVFPDLKHSQMDLTTLQGRK